MTTKVKKAYSLVPSQNQSLLDWKKQGKKAIGVFCHNIPREMIYAAGILPIRLLGNTEPLQKAADRFRYCCYYSRSTFEMALRGDLDALDGLCMIDMCDTQRYGFGFWQKYLTKFPYIYFFIPILYTRATGALQFYMVELDYFKRSLEELSGNEITNQSLAEAIELYNKNRALLKEIYDLRGKGVLSGLEVAEAALSSTQMPPEKNNRLLSSLVEEAKNRNNPPFNGPRLHLSGSLMPNLDFFKLVEDCGGMVVSDDLCIGSRYFWEPIYTSLNPYEAIAACYSVDQKIMCPSMQNPESSEIRVAFITELMRRYNADAVCFVNQMYCGSHFMDYPYVSNALKEKEIPTLLIEMEQEVAPAAVKTRVEAFLEMLKEEKGE